MNLQTTSEAAPMAAAPEESPEDLVARLARDGRAAQRVLARLSDTEKADALRAAASALRGAAPAILEANARDVVAGEEKGLTGPM